MGSRNVLSSSGQSTIAMRVEVHRVDWGIVIVPGDQQWGGFHGGSSVPRRALSKPGDANGEEERSGSWFG